MGIHNVGTPFIINIVIRQGVQFTLLVLPLSLSRSFVRSFLQHSNNQDDYELAIMTLKLVPFIIVIMAPYPPRDLFVLCVGRKEHMRGLGTMLIAFGEVNIQEQRRSYYSSLLYWQWKWWEYRRVSCKARTLECLTFSSHSHFQALFQPTKLTLVPVMLVDRTVPISSAGVGQVTTNTSLEETFTTCKVNQRRD